MKVINFFGGPGSGKSTMACALFVEMKKLGYNIEYVDEYAKEKVYEGEFSKLKDQLYILANQNRKLNRLRNQVDFAITDSPLLLSIYYNINNIQNHSKNSLTYPEKVFNELVYAIWNQYDNYSIYLTRNLELPFQSFGRNFDFDQSLQIDNKLVELFEYDMMLLSGLDNVNKILDSDEFKSWSK